MKSKLLYISTLLISLVLLQSVTCNKDPQNAKWSSASFDAVQVVNDSAKSFQYLQLQDSDTIILNDGRLGFTLNISYEIIAMQDFDFSIIKMANATSFGPPTFIMENSIDSVRVFTLRSFDAQHPINSEVNDLLAVVYKRKFTNFQSIIDAETMLNSVYQEIDWGGYRFNIMLKQNPQDDSLVQFKSIVYFSNRKTAIDTSQLVLIKY